MSTTITYNGIDLAVTNVQDWHREPMLDSGGHYMYSKNRLSFLAIYNPQGTSYNLPGGQAVPVKTSGYRGPYTDIAIRHQLQQSQREFIYKVGDITVLDSPGLGPDGNRMPVDCYNGPNVIAVDVTRVVGTKTYAVSMTIETYVNECNLFKTTPAALVSHRWSRHEDVDQDYFSTLHTEGRAMFRTDLLAAIGANPDDFRAFLFHPCPEGFKRSSIQVSATDDGATLQYSFVDRMLPMYHNLVGVSRIEAYHTAHAKGIDFEKKAREVATAMTEWISLTGAVSDPLLPLRAAAKAELCNIPMTNIIVDAKVFGKPFSVRKNLERVAVAIVMARLSKSLNPVARFTGGKEISLTHDVTGKVVHCHCSLTTALGMASYQGLFTNYNMPAVGNCFPADAETTVSPDTVILSDSFLGALSAPNHNGTRGGYVGALVAQALLNPCGTYSTPGTARVANQYPLNKGQ